MKPTKDKIEQALLLLTTFDRQLRFYEGLKNPEWFEGLYDYGVFKIRTLDDGAEPVAWPPLKYLKNIATTLPDAVSLVLKETDSNSAFIRRDLVEALLALPDAQVLQIVPKAKWLRHPARGGAIYVGIIRVVDRLCQLNRAGDAFMVGRWLLQLRAEEPSHIYELEILNRPRAVADLMDGSFGTVLTKVTDAISKVDPIKAVALVADRLNRALHIEQRLDRENDLSYVWLADFNAPPGSYDLKKKLASLLGTLCRGLPPELDDPLFELLDACDAKSSIYHRLKVLRIVDRADFELARGLLLSPEFWADHPLVNERPLVLKTFFVRLNEGDRSAVIQLIRESIPVDLYVRSVRENFGFEAGDDERQQFFNQHFVDALAPIEEHLSGVDLEAYNVTKAGIPVAPPKAKRPTTASLDNKTIDEALNIVDRFMASGDLAEDGSLFHELRNAVQNRVLDFISKRDRLKALHPENVAAVLYGTFTASRAGTQVDEMHVLNAIEDVLDRAERAEPITLPEKNAIFPLHSWGDILRTCTLLMDDLARTPSLQNADRYVRILSRISRYNEDRAEASGTRVARSLDTLQSSSVLTLAYLAPKLKRANHPVEAVFEELHRVVALKRPATMAALGQAFTSLFSANGEWTSKNVEGIFATGDPIADRSAWQGYLLHSQIYAGTYAILKSVYRAHVSDLGDALQTGYEEREERRTFLTHVWVLYANAIESTDDASSLVSRLLSGAGDKTISRFLQIVGGDLSNSILPEDMVARAMALIDPLVETVREKRRTGAALLGFGSWVGARTVPANWRTQRLESILKLTDGRIESEHNVIQALGESANEDPFGTMRCTRLLVEAIGSQAQIAISQFGEPIFAAAVSSGGEALEQARIVNGILIDSGITTFFEMVKKSKLGGGAHD